MKIFVYNRRVNGMFDSLKCKVRRVVRVAQSAALVLSAFAVVFFIGAATFSTSTSMVTANTIELPVVSPVLDRIGDCESGNGAKGTATHYRNGQTLMSPNTNGTVDVGKYQINSVWFKKATELGLDITKEEDNRKMAEWIYLNRGTGDWYASAKCWQLK